MSHPLLSARALSLLALVLVVLPAGGPASADTNEGAGSTSAREATISAAGTHTCALLSNGAVSCWGSNKYEELGDAGLSLNRSTPVFVTGLDGSKQTPRAVAVTSGDYHSCALLVSGAVRCWGYNVLGQLGDGTSTNRVIAAPVLGLDGTAGSPKATAISAASDHTCALLATGAAVCWGSNSVGRLGEGAPTADSSKPVPVLGIDGATAETSAIAISAGSSHTCAVMRSGAVRCWGYNGSGELGDNSTVNRFAPVQVFGIDGSSPSTSATAISVGSSHSCAVMRSGAAECWGYNAYGKLGDGTTTNRSAPVAVSGIDGSTDALSAVAISVGDAHSCAALKSGRAACWGYNAYGELGNSNTGNSSIPVAVTGIDGSTPASSAAAISAGVSHTCVVLATGHVTCWGFNGTGELGDDSIEDRSTPREVAGLSLIVAVSNADTRSGSVPTPAGVPSNGHANGGLTAAAMALFAVGILALGTIVSNARRRSRCGGASSAHGSGSDQ